MAKFKITVTRVDEYEIEVDESVWTEKDLRDWSEIFFPAETPQELAEHSATAWMRNDTKYFIEGFGYVRELDKDNKVKGIPYEDKEGKVCYPLPDDRYSKGLSIKAISFDEDYDTQVEVL